LNQNERAGRVHSPCCYYFTIFRSTSIDHDVNEMKWKMGSQTVLLSFSFLFLYLSLKSHREISFNMIWNLGLDVFNIKLFQSIPLMTLLFPLRRGCTLWLYCLYQLKCLFNQDQVRHLNNSIIMTTISISIELILLMSTTSSIHPFYVHVCPFCSLIVYEKIHNCKSVQAGWTASSFPFPLMNFYMNIINLHSSLPHCLPTSLCDVVTDTCHQFCYMKKYEKAQITEAA
jgi:hypothetical protein